MVCLALARLGTIAVPIDYVSCNVAAQHFFLMPGLYVGATNTVLDGPDPATLLATIERKPATKLFRPPIAWIYPLRDVGGLVDSRPAQHAAARPIHRGRAREMRAHAANRVERPGPGRTLAVPRPYRAELAQPGGGHRPLRRHSGRPDEDRPEAPAPS